MPTLWSVPSSMRFRPVVLHHRVAADGVAGHHHVLADVLLIGLHGGLHPVGGLHQGLGVGHPGAHLDDDRAVIFLGDLIGLLGEGQGLGGVGGLQHGDFRRLGVVAGVLLVLGGVHPRVVGHHDDHARVHASVGHGEQGVGGHVQAHVLHAAEGALSRQGGAEGGLHGHLLVGGPLAVDVVKLGGLLGDLGAGGAGVAGDHAAPRLIQSTGNGGVAQHQLFHLSFSLLSCKILGTGLLLLVQPLPDDDVPDHPSRAVFQHGAADPADGGAAGPGLLQDVQIDQALL